MGEVVLMFFKLQFSEILFVDHHLMLAETILCSKRGQTLECAMLPFGIEGFPYILMFAYVWDHVGSLKASCFVPSTSPLFKLRIQPRFKSTILEWYGV